MKKIIPILLLSFLLVSCNFSLFNSSFKDMTNYSPSLPEVPSSPISPQVSVSGLRCSDGLFTDKITISWKQLNGANYNLACGNIFNGSRTTCFLKNTGVISRCSLHSGSDTRSFGEQKRYSLSLHV